VGGYATSLLQQCQDAIPQGHAIEMFSCTQSTRPHSPVREPTWVGSLILKDHDVSRPDK